MNIREIRDLKTEELHLELDRIRRHLFDLRAQAVTEKLSDTSHLAQTKREIARIFTVLTERGEKDVENQQYHLETRATHR